MGTADTVDEWNASGSPYSPEPSEKQFAEEVWQLAALGKGKGKSKGKGSPKGGCFKCGGPHYAANCPCAFAGGKGKGKDWSPPHMQQGQQGS